MENDMRQAAHPPSGRPQDEVAAPSSVSIPPTSPNLTSLHAHQPTAEAQDLRRRPPASASAGSQQSVRICIATPLTDMYSMRRKEVIMGAHKLVSQLKDDIAFGALASEEGERWEREGMRLVYHGRIVRDEETLGSIVNLSRPSRGFDAGEANDGSAVHTFHLVARRIGGPSTVPLPALRAQPAPDQPTPALPHASPGPSASMPPVASAQYAHQLALNQTVHFLMFKARHHLCHLMSAPILRWDEIVPRPTLSEEEASGFVQHVIEQNIQCGFARQEQLPQWQNAFETDFEGIWAGLERTGCESEIKTLWEKRVGRSFRDRKEGEDVLVELDGQTQSLRLPPLAKMTPSQLIHLLLYLRTSLILPVINGIYLEALQPSPVTFNLPAATHNPTSAPRRTFAGIRLRFQRLAVRHVGLMLLKIVAFATMLVWNMQWDDPRFYIIVGGSALYWLVLAFVWFRPEILWRQNGGQAAAPAGAHPPHNGFQAYNMAVAGPGHAQDAAWHAGHGADAAAQAYSIPSSQSTNPANAPAGPEMQQRIYATAARHLRNEPRPAVFPTNIFPYVLLDADAQYLRLTPPTRFYRPPSRLTRHLTRALLIPYLWLMSLVPAWQDLRTAAIRRRERAIRAVVLDLSGGQAALDAQLAAAGTAATSDGEGSGGQQGVNIVYPEHLDRDARKYYQRVWSRGESIDWEEERAAQRGMGVEE